MKKDIFDLLKLLEEKSKVIDEAFLVESEFLDEEISLVWDIIIEKYNLENSDEVIDVLYKFGIGEIPKKGLIKQIKIWTKS